MPILAILVPATWAWSTAIARGAVDAARERGWDLRCCTDALSPARQSDWLTWAAADAAVYHPIAWSAPLVTRRVPARIAVCASSGRFRVAPDDLAVGEAAGRHLLATGMTTCAWVGGRGTAWAELRERGLRRVLAAARVPLVARHSWDGALAPDARLRQLSRFLAGLPLPIALMASHDAAASDVAQAAAALGIAIPDQLRIIGVDDDPLRCHSVVPALSSVRLPWDEVGRRAVALVAERLAGRPVAPLLVPPLGVAERGSTCGTALTDPLVARCLALIDARVTEPWSVATLAAALSVSRRTLEQRVRRMLGCSPLVALNRARVRRMQLSLEHAELGVAQAAAQSGFSSLAAAREHFRTVVGCTPAAWHRDRS